MVKLVQANDDNAMSRIFNIMEKIREDHDGSFAGKWDRMMCSGTVALIKYNDEDVGFIYATPEEKYKKGLFIDMSLLKEYRNKGIGKEALERFIIALGNEDEYLMGEVEKDNIGSNIISEKLGVKIIDGDKNYYLFPKSKLKEFLEKEDLEEVISSLSRKAKNSHQVLCDIMESESVVKTK